MSAIAFEKILLFYERYPSRLSGKKLLLANDLISLEEILQYRIKQEFPYNDFRKFQFQTSSAGPPCAYRMSDLQVSIEMIAAYHSRCSFHFMLELFVDFQCGRIRRVKCDEKKPSCRRCTDTGRTCDGYPPIKTRAVAPICLDSDNRLGGLLEGMPSLEISGSQAEKRLFNLFRHQFSNFMANSMNLRYAFQFMLQYSHVDDAMRHSILALGSIGEVRAINPELTLDSSRGRQLYSFALLQYGKALEHLQAQIFSSASTRSLTLVFSFLFAILETLLGNEREGLVHFKAGLRLISEETREEIPTATSDGLTRSTKKVLRDEIAQSFSVMAIESTLWLGNDEYHTLALRTQEELGPFPEASTPDHFKNVEEASESFLHHVNRLLRFRRIVASWPWSNRPDQTPRNFIIYYRKLVVDFERWYEKVEILQKQIADKASLYEVHRITLMKMNYMTTLISCTACICPDNTRHYKECESDFRKVVSYARTILLPDDDQTTELIKRIIFVNNHSPATDCHRGHPWAYFALHVGLIPPLFFTAVKCGNVSICDEALQLLSTRLWREGPWDSLTMARLARKGGRYLQHVTEYSHVMRVSTEEAPLCQLNLP